MRKQTLLNHLRETKSAIRTERPRIKNQEKFIREMKADGHDIRAMNDLLRTMKANLIELQRHREVLSVQLELFATNRSSGRNSASEHARKLGLEGIFSEHDAQCRATDQMVADLDAIVAIMKRARGKDERSETRRSA